MHEAAFAAEGVSKGFGSVRALDNVTLAVRAGEMLALVGQTGAGKSTLVRIIQGVIRPDQGTLTAQGAQQEFRSPADAHAVGIRVVNQEPNIFPDLSIAENLFLGDFPRTARLFANRGDLARRTQSLLSEFELDKALGPWTKAGDLSPAQRKLIEILSALRAGLRVLVLDEPTSLLTGDDAQRLFRVLRRLRDDGVGVIYVSRKVRESRQLANRLAVLCDGRLVEERPTADFTEDEIAQAMGVLPVDRLFEAGARRIGKEVLSVRSVRTKRVANVSFDIHSGEIVGLASLVGVGRSQLAKAIFGCERVLSGSVSVDGQTIHLSSPADAIAAGIGFAPEDPKSQALLPLRSVKENMLLLSPGLISRLNFVDSGAERRIASELADRLSIGAPDLDAFASDLSAGNQQKVILGRWLLRRPKVMILDEPTRFLDVGARAEIHRLIAKLAEEGTALLIISSDVPELVELADRILVMASGRIVADLPRGEATEHRVLGLAVAGVLAPGTVAA